VCVCVCVCVRERERERGRFHIGSLRNWQHLCDSILHMHLNMYVRILIFVYLDFRALMLVT
jgi:hypothetical protein